MMPLYAGRQGRKVETSSPGIFSSRGTYCGRQQAHRRGMSECMDCIKFVQIYGILMQANPALVASSSQSRADVATICIAAVLGLTGLQWLSLKPKTPQTVTLDGTPVMYIADGVEESKEEIFRCVLAMRLCIRMGIFSSEM